ncbi:DUF3089 domain-containing protein [Sphingomonas oleivorans]|nr:DUF3089 domain-containing protein [Sphingomonas oleivorans]
MLVLAATIGWNLFQDQILRATFVPSVGFAPPPPDTAPDYTRPAAWLSRPDLPDDPARFVPEGFARAEQPDVAVFYVAPTTYLRRDRWNAPLDDAQTNDRQRIFASSQASAFNGMGAIWAPRYRQATMGAFLTDGESAAQALDFAYGDVLRAFDAFLASIPASRPILLAGHSQGSLHLIRLMQERIAGQPIARRIVAAYLVGWPISIEADLPALGLPACTGPGQAGCVISWQSFADPADPRMIREYYDASTGLTGRSRRGTEMLCTNPLTGAPHTAALATANRGSLVPRPGAEEVNFTRGLVPARCDSSGLLLIGREPAGYGRYVLPGRNYHVFDYALFWANIRVDAQARAATFLKR